MKAKLILYNGIVVLVILMNFCKDPLENTMYFTADIPSITQRMEMSPDTFSNFISLLKQTGFYSSLSSYGSYTCFVPDNKAIQTYISSRWGVNSVDQLTSEQQIADAKYLLKFHILKTRKLASSFAEGRLSDTTYSGDFLTTSFAGGGGISNVLVDKQSTIIVPDIITGNGVIHVLNRVLDPFIDPLPVSMEKNGKYTIFVEALKKTGYFNKLSAVYSSLGKRIFFTVLAESDSILKISNINSFNDLAAAISPGNTDYLVLSNPLNQFIAYHSVASFFYTADFPENGFVTTLLENAAIKCQKVGNFIKLNETETGLNDRWVNFILPKSNYPSRNGVYHSVDTIMNVFTPKPKFIIFSAAGDQPEVLSGSIASGVSVPSTAYSEIDWYPERNQRWLKETSRVFYKATNFDIGGAAWYEFITPVIPKGKYEFMISALSGSARGVFQIYWDGEPVGSVYQLNYSNATTAFGWPDSATMETYGWRHGHKWIKVGTQYQYDQSGNCRFIITRELLCPVQKRHTLRIVAIRSGGLPLDYFEWNPVL